MKLSLETLWYQGHPLKWLLWPLSLVFQLAAVLRGAVLKTFFQKSVSVPVVVVGNITAGGVGKTPLVIALVKACQEKGLRVAVVSRGYKASVRKFPHVIKMTDSASAVGDEPLLIAEKTACPVIIDPRRSRAVDCALQQFKSQIIISDDGLQHYRMGRALEIAVIDGQRGLGNGFCLPAGPLRESQRRLKKTAMLVVNEGIWPGAFQMNIKPGHFIALNGQQAVSKEELSQPLAAVAGIGNPGRFYSTLQTLDLSFKTYTFPDHHAFSAKDLQVPESSVVMTEKDAVKCRSFAEDHWYFLPVEASLPEAFWHKFWSSEPLKGLLS